MKENVLLRCLLLMLLSCCHRLQTHPTQTLREIRCEGMSQGRTRDHERPTIQFRAQDLSVTEMAHVS